MFDIWNQKNELAEKAYCEDNYKIQYHNDVDNNECVIYFSSNGIWFPNTEEIFRREIIQNDRYEWIHRPYRMGRKNIFVRDICKSKKDVEYEMNEKTSTKYFNELRIFS